MTPVERLAQYVRDRYPTNKSFENLVSNLKEREKQNISQALSCASNKDELIEFLRKLDFYRD